MCKNCEKLRNEIAKLKEQMKQNYDWAQELKGKFTKLSTAYCYIAADDFDLV
jgi:hypothetical protein